MSAQGSLDRGAAASSHTDEESQGQLPPSSSSSTASMTRSISQTSTLSSSSSSSRNVSPRVRRQPPALEFWQRQGSANSVPSPQMTRQRSTRSSSSLADVGLGGEESTISLRMQQGSWEAIGEPRQQQTESANHQSSAPILTPPRSLDAAVPRARGLNLNDEENTQQDEMDRVTTDAQDLGIGSSRRLSIGHQVTHSLQESPPQTQSGVGSMATTLSHTPRRSLPSNDSAEDHDQSFYDAADDEEEDEEEEEEGGSKETTEGKAPRECERHRSGSRTVAALSPVLGDQQDSSSSEAVSPLSNSSTHTEGTSSGWLGATLQRDIEVGVAEKPSSSTLRQDSRRPSSSQHFAATRASMCVANSIGSPASVSSSVWLPGSPSEGASSPSFLPSPGPTTTSFVHQHHNVIPPPRPLPDGPLPPTPVLKSTTEIEAASAASSSIAESSFTSSISGDASFSGLSQAESSAPVLNQRRNSVASINNGHPPLLHSATSPTPVIASASPSSINIPIRGRARGYTVGAVPASGRYPPFLGRYNPQKPPGPRSLLSRELILPEFEGPMTTTSTSGDSKEGEESSLPASSSLPNELNRGAAVATTASSQVGSSRRTSLETGPDAVGAARSSLTSLSTLDEDAKLATRATAREDINASSSSQNLPSPASTPASVPAGRSRSGSTASVLLQQVQHPPRSHASFVIAVIGHKGVGKTVVVKKGLKQFGLSKPQILSEKVTSHSTLCVVNHEQRSIEVLEIDTTVLLTNRSDTVDDATDTNHNNRVFVWPPYLPKLDAVILCYDASDKSSFRGMSNLLEKFAVEPLCIVMLACKSDLHPKLVDPYHASDMAGVYNVGLAECTVRTEEGKKRMRDCFSYLVKEVAKGRHGRPGRLRGTSSTTLASPLTEDAESVTTTRQPRHRATDSDGSNFDRTLSLSPHRARCDQRDDMSPGVRDRSPASGWESTASSSSREPGPSGRDEGDRFSRRPSSAFRASRAISGAPSPRLASDNSEAPSAVGEQSEEDVSLPRGAAKLQMGLQNAKSAGGYVTLEELWDKLFFAAVSGNDPRFVLMFMVFYRGFVRPVVLLNELITRFETLASGEQQDGTIIRFALMQLTKMLGDWVQDYPGDLSGPETYPLLCSFFERLCRHPSTTHIASLLHSHIENVKDAPDLDAAWSKDQDSSRAKSVAADIPPVRPPMPMERPDFPASILRETGRERSDSDVSAAPSNGSSRSDIALGTAIPPSHMAALVGSDATRSRSASDATGLMGHNGEGVPMRGYASSSSVNIAPSIVDSLRGDGSLLINMDAHQQKLSLRAVSQLLETTDDMAIATELTRLEWELFIAISPRDLLRHILVPRIVRGNDGPVARSIIHFNYISFWVCSMILVQQKVKNRARMLEKFMSIASTLRHNNNYNTLQAVLAGLNNASIHRLRSTREAMASKSVSKVYQSLTRLMSSDRSFAAYRLALENSDGRTIPYLGVHLQDILSMSDGNPSKRASDDMVHWRKFSLMDEAVMAIVRCQKEDQPMKVNAHVEKLIMQVPVMDEDALYQRSLTVEPRQGGASTTAGSKILKMLNNS